MQKSTYISWRYFSQYRYRTSEHALYYMAARRMRKRNLSDDAVHISGSETTSDTAMADPIARRPGCPSLRIDASTLESPQS